MKNLKGYTKLTPREAEVMSYVVKGYSNQQIADEMFITKHTVKAHISSAFSKLHVKNRWDAAMTILNIKTSNT